MNIENATLDDVDAVYRIMSQEDRTAYTRDLVIDLITSENSICLTLTDNGSCIGALGARAEGAHSYWLYFIVIDTAHRGKGNSKLLMDELFLKVKEKGARRIALDSPDEEYFKKLGFTEVGRIPNWYEDKDQVIMFKELSD